MDDPVSKAYTAMHTRLYLIGKNGRVVYAGGLGPYGFNPSALKTVIEQFLEVIDQETSPDPLTGD